MGLSKRIKFKCDYCDNENEQDVSHYNSSNRHFCNRKCYSSFRREKLPFTEQPAYKGVRKEGDSYQIYYKNYCKRNKDVIAHFRARVNAKKKGAVGSHSFKDWVDLKNKFNNRCAICGEEKKLTKDHIIPLFKKGTDYIENIQPLCRNCNSKKWIN